MSLFRVCSLLLSLVLKKTAYSLLIKHMLFLKKVPRSSTASAVCLLFKYPWFWLKKSINYFQLPEHQVRLHQNARNSFRVKQKRAKNRIVIQRRQKSQYYIHKWPNYLTFKHEGLDCLILLWSYIRRILHIYSIN